jgi:hypothetical protein
MLHYAALNWHLPKRSVMERVAFDSLTPERKKRLVEHEYSELVRAVNDKTDRSFRRSGLTHRQLALEDALEESLFEQTHEYRDKEGNPTNFERPN